MGRCAECEEKNKRALERLLKTGAARDGDALARALVDAGLGQDVIDFVEGNKLDGIESPSKPDIRIYAADEKWEDLRKRGPYLEIWREYVYPDMVYRIDNAVKLIVKRKPEGDSHRVIDAFGTVHYVPIGWRAIRFRNDGEDRHLE